MFSFFCWFFVISELKCRIYIVKSPPLVVMEQGTFCSKTYLFQHFFFFLGGGGCRSSSTLLPAFVIGLRHLIALSCAKSLKNLNPIFYRPGPTFKWNRNEFERGGKIRKKGRSPNVGNCHICGLHRANSPNQSNWQIQNLDGFMSI